MNEKDARHLGRTAYLRGDSREWALRHGGEIAANEWDAESNAEDAAMTTDAKPEAQGAGDVLQCTPVAESDLQEGETYLVATKHGLIEGRWEGDAFAAYFWHDMTFYGEAFTVPEIVARLTPPPAGDTGDLVKRLNSLADILASLYSDSATEDAGGTGQADYVLPDGWVAVPLTLTLSMARALENAAPPMTAERDERLIGDWADAWHEVLTAAPPRPTEDDEAIVERMAQYMAASNEVFWPDLREEDPTYEDRADYRRMARAALASLRPGEK